MDIKRINQQLTYLVLNGIFALFLYYGFYTDIVGVSEMAKNFALIIVGITSVVCILAKIALMIDKERFIEHMKENYNSSVPFWFDLLFDIGVSLVLVLNEHYIFAFFYISHIVIMREIHNLIKKKRNEYESC